MLRFGGVQRKRAEAHGALPKDVEAPFESQRGAEATQGVRCSSSESQLRTLAPSSRELAEQEIHLFLASPTDYMASQTPERQASIAAEFAPARVHPLPAAS